MSEKLVQNQMASGKRLSEYSRTKHDTFVEGLAAYLKDLAKPVSISDISRETGRSKISIKKNLQEAIEKSGCKFEVFLFGNAKVLNKKVS